MKEIKHFMYSERNDKITNFKIMIYFQNNYIQSMIITDMHKINYNLLKLCIYLSIL
jgi:hypothetical protein